MKRKTPDEEPKLIDLTSIAVQPIQPSHVDDDDDDHKIAALSAINPDDLSTWPKPDVLGLNESQFMAFHAALTKEFAVIQGPPGTGKTYMGLKIAQALHENRKLWVDKEDEVTPILMVAYTNHALDQFLEGLYREKG